MNAPDRPDFIQRGTSPHRDQPVRHAGPCGPREACWRAECRRIFGDYLTVERLGDGHVIAFCHGANFTVSP